MEGLTADETSCMLCDGDRYLCRISQHEYSKAFSSLFSIACLIWSECDPSFVLESNLVEKEVSSFLTFHFPESRFLCLSKFRGLFVFFLSPDLWIAGLPAAAVSAWFLLQHVILALKSSLLFI